MRYLCFDIGTKRTGIAAGDDETVLAGPFDVVECGREQGLVKRLIEVIERERPDGLVIGHPINMDGTEGAQARIVREIAEEIMGKTGVQVILHDERLSTESAHEQMSRTGLTHQQKKARRDALAAAAILQDYLNSHPRGDSAEDESVSDHNP